jgi:hypothetical protein
MSCEAKFDLTWVELPIWLCQIIDLAFILFGIFTMNVIPKILPSQMEMYFLMLGKFNVLSKIN